MWGEDAMRFDRYSWRLQHHKRIYAVLWTLLCAYCFFGPLFFEWRHMDRFILIYLTWFGVLGWLTWSKPGGVLWNKPPTRGDA